MARVLLTGGAGFIGTHVRGVLQESGHDVLTFDSMRPDVHQPHPERVDDLVVGDVRDASALDDVLPKVDAVIHLAAKVGLGVDVQDQPDYADSNVHGTAVLLAAMARARVRRLVLAGSMVAYGEGLGLCTTDGPVRPAARRPADLEAGHFESPCPRCGAALQPMLVDESAPLDPRNAYAASKVAQEHFAAAWADAVDGTVAVMRFHNVYGPGLPLHTPYAGVAAIFLSALRSGRAPQVNEDGAMRRDFVHVRDVARACVAALHHDHHVRAYNVGSGTVRTVGDMAAELARATGGPDPVVTGSYRVGDVRHITADSSRLTRELPWTAQEDFGDGMAELARKQSALGSAP